MPEPQDPGALLVAHLAWIDRVAGSLCRRSGLDPDETDDFASWAKARLVEDDYAVLRKFRGESSLTTYLTVVLTMLYRDYRASRWGRWRPSAAARRRGPVAVRLETLVYRDGYPWSQAAAVVRARGDTPMSEGELTTLAAQLSSVRGRPVAAGDQPLASIPGPDGAEDRVRAAESAAEHGAAERGLARAIEALPEEDRLILKMKFWEGSSVAEIARMLRMEQQPLYRRLKRMLLTLRAELESNGISRERVRALLDEEEEP